MTYSVKEIFLTLQGEGINAGRAAVFLRFSGCNLWSGKERHRARAVCQFCDTDFVGVDGSGGGKFREPLELAAHVQAHWRNRTHPPSDRVPPLVVCTGGEPLLQLDPPLVSALQEHGFEVAIETNGTVAAPAGIDWICVSPKAGTPLIQRAGNELKLVYPQPGAEPDRFVDLAFEHFLLQPMDGPQLEQNARSAIQYCLNNPRWRLSVQTHKLIGFR